MAKNLHLQKKTFVLCQFHPLSLTVTEGGPLNTSHGETRQRWVSLGQLWHVLHFLNTHLRQGKYWGVSHTHTQLVTVPYIQQAPLKTLTFSNNACLAPSPHLLLSRAQWSGVTHIWSRISCRFLLLSGETKLAFLRATRSSIYKQ